MGGGDGGTMMQAYAAVSRASFNFDTLSDCAAGEAVMSVVSPFSYDVPCPQCPLRVCEIFHAVGDEELDFISALKVGELRTGPASTMLQEGSPSDQLFTLLEGGAFRYKTLDDGRRQITRLRIAGRLHRHSSVDARRYGSLGRNADPGGAVLLPPQPRLGAVPALSEPRLRHHLACRTSGIDPQRASLEPRPPKRGRVCGLLHLAPLSAGRRRGARHRRQSALSLHAGASRRCARSFAGPHQQDPEEAHGRRPHDLGAWLVLHSGRCAARRARQVGFGPAPQAPLALSRRLPWPSRAWLLSQRSRRRI